MKTKLIQALLPDDDNENMVDELQALIDKLPPHSKEYKVLCNLSVYFDHIQDNEIDMIADLKDSPVMMMAASLRAMGFIGDTARDENITALILQSAQMAWIIKRELSMSVVN